MSRASAYVVTFDGERVAEGLYCGSSDVMQPWMTETSDEAWDIYYDRAKRSDGRNPWDVLCECEHSLEAGYCYADYGYGFYWPVQFCRECMVIRGPLTWDEMYGLPPDPGVWPKRGRPPIEADARAIQRALNPAE